MPITLEKICLYCQQSFTVTGKPWIVKSRKYCQQSCSAKANAKNFGVPKIPWTPEESAMLISMIGSVQQIQIMEEWNDIAAQNGWTERSPVAIQGQISKWRKKYGLNTSPTIENWNTSSLSKFLEISIERVLLWCRRGLRHKRYGKRIITITKSDLRRYAVKKPNEFWSISPSKLGKALGDNQLAKEICTLAVDPKGGRSIVVVRLDRFEVYKSAYSADKLFNFGKNKVIQNCERDTPMRGGEDFAQLDYPPYIVPLAVREEFNKLAGKLLFDIYTELRKLDGYKKTTCLVVAGRLAVQIALMTFKRKFKSLEEGEIIDVNCLADFWKGFFLEKLHHLLALPASSRFKALLQIIRKSAYKSMAKRVGLNDLESHLDEFVGWYIGKITERYQRTTYLPYNYHPVDVLGNIDLYVYLWSSFWAKIELPNGDRVPSGFLLVKEYCNRFVSKDSHYNDELKNASGNVESANAIDKILEFIETSTRLSQKDKEQLSLYIAMKLEECSDDEVASTMQCSALEVRRLEKRLQGVGEEYMQLAG